MVRKLWMAAVALTLIGASARAADERHTIRPGDGIGVIKLGMTVPQVHAAMEEWGAKSMLTGSKGGPGAWLDEQAGAAIEAYQTDSLGHGQWGNTMKVFYVKNRVAQISVQSVAYATNRGANSRMSSGEFRQIHSSLHPLSVQESWGGRIRAYDSERLGLAVTYPVLSGDRETRSAQEIFVHNPGMPLMLESARHAGAVTKPGVDNTKNDQGPTTAGR